MGFSPVQAGLKEVITGVFWLLEENSSRRAERRGQRQEDPTVEWPL